MFDHLLESSHRDDSNKWSNVGFGEKITQEVLNVVNFTHLIWSSEFIPFSFHLMSDLYNTWIYRRASISRTRIGRIHAKSFSFFFK